MLAGIHKINKRVWTKKLGNTFPFISKACYAINKLPVITAIKMLVSFFSRQLFCLACFEQTATFGRHNKLRHVISATKQNRRNCTKTFWWEQMETRRNKFIRQMLKANELFTKLPFWLRPLMFWIAFREIRLNLMFNNSYM